VIIMDALELTRRQFLQAAIAGAALTSASAAQRLVPTDPDVEGPFYKAGAPFREEIFAPGKRGTQLEISGRVLSTNGEAIRGALLDLWNANPQGIYDLQGFEFRGKVKTDSTGHYRFVTFRPPPYGNRTAHLHFKVSGQDHHPLTTELFFKGEPKNYRDGYVRPSRVVRVRTGAVVHSANFDFVLVGV